jgi:hypothetical protein
MFNTANRDCAGGQHPGDGGQHPGDRAYDDERK